MANNNKAVDEARARLAGMGVPESTIAWYTADDPNDDLLAVAIDERKEVLIFKVAVALGFDAPRAFTLVSMRGAILGAAGEASMPRTSWKWRVELPWHAMSMAIMVIVVYIFIPNRLIYSLAVALPATGVFIYLASVIGSLKSADMLTMSMLLLLANISLPASAPTASRYSCTTASASGWQCHQHM